MLISDKLMREKYAADIDPSPSSTNNPTLVFNRHLMLDMHVDNFIISLHPSLLNHCQHSFDTRCHPPSLFQPPTATATHKHHH